MKSILRLILVIFISTGLFFGAHQYMIHESQHLSSKVLADFGVDAEGNFTKPEPNYPNYVCTQAKNLDRFVAPIDTSAWKRDDLEIVRLMRDTLMNFINNKVIEDKGDYLHIAITTPLNLIDDVEVFYDEATHMIHFRSACRVGYFDFGINKNRYKSFKESLLMRLEIQ